MRVSVCCRILFCWLAIQTLPCLALAQNKCLDAEGEAVIVNGDLPSAKAEALARAKWAAAELAVGIEVKAQSVVQNMMLVDEAISKQVNGSVQKFKVLSQQQDGDLMRVKINACIESNKAKETFAGLAQNNAISVFLLARDPANRSRDYNESNVLAETIIGRLAEKGYTVTDIAASGALNEKEVRSAIKEGKLPNLRNVIYRFLTNVVLIGKVDYTHSTEAGRDVGYGISMPFNHVTARITYRMIGRNAAGEQVIVAAGTGQGHGVAYRTEDAAAESLKDLAETLSPVLVQKISDYMLGANKKVEVKIRGVSELSENFEVKEILQNLAWVTKVEEQGLGEFTVLYPENPIYLANSISQKGEFKLESYSPSKIEFNYRMKDKKTKEETKKSGSK